MKATYKIDNGVLLVTAKLPSGKQESKPFILANLLLKCTSIFDLEFGFDDIDGQTYYYFL